jgi:glyoxylase-like metal-dependent hydrolase (beta-lactamase superfamily II)
VTYVDEIKKVSNQPIKYLIYSHQHFDRHRGRQRFKDAGATIVAHTRAKEWLLALRIRTRCRRTETVDCQHVTLATRRSS